MRSANVLAARPSEFGVPARAVAELGGGMLTMTGVRIVGGANTATISVALPSSGVMYGHSNFVTVIVANARSVSAT